MNDEDKNATIKLQALQLEQANLFVAAARKLLDSHAVLASERLTLLITAKAALTQIACFSEGATVTGNFDEPHSASVAREALEKMGEKKP